MSKDLLQIHMKNTFRPLKAEDLTDREKYEALESLMFLKEKRDGTGKRQACADDRKRISGSSKEGATLPTVSLGAVLITSVIDAYEGIDMEIFDVPGAFLTAYHNEAINITLIGKLANIMVKTLLKYIGNTFTITWHVEDLGPS